MKRITVEASRIYDILIADGLIDEVGSEILKIHSPCSVMLLSDATVAALYSKRVCASLGACGFSVSSFIIEPGESSKSVENLAALWEALAQAKMSRSDIIIALGGGVCGDLAGFAAATYMRGIEYIQIPTTLLAMVDSSVGGKTAVDLEHGKNLAGAFWQPSLVLCDPQVLSTLEDEHFADGMAEVIKYGFIDCPELIALLETEHSIAEIIAICVENKRDIVQADERDNGCRQLLNFGHTLAHGIELLSGYTVSHGKAVAVGMVLITKAAIIAGLCESDVLPKLLSLLEKYNLPSETLFSVEELCLAALEDKKRKGSSITLVIPKKLGKCELFKLPVDKLLDFIGTTAEDK